MEVPSSFVIRRRISPQQTNRFCSRSIIGGPFLSTTPPGTQFKKAVLDKNDWDYRIQTDPISTSLLNQSALYSEDELSNHVDLSR